MCCHPSCSDTHHVNLRCSCFTDCVFVVVTWMLSHWVCVVLFIPAVSQMASSDFVFLLLPAWKELMEHHCNIQIKDFAQLKVEALYSAHSNGWTMWYTVWKSLVLNNRIIMCMRTAKSIQPLCQSHELMVGKPSYLLLCSSECSHGMQAKCTETHTDHKWPCDKASLHGRCTCDQYIKNWSNFAASNGKDPQDFCIGHSYL